MFDSYHKEMLVSFSKLKVEFLTKVGKKNKRERNSYAGYSVNAYFLALLSLKSCLYDSSITMNSQNSSYKRSAYVSVLNNYNLSSWLISDYQHLDVFVSKAWNSSEIDKEE